MAPLPRRSFHAFVTHDWGVDGEGRDNHERVIAVARALEKAGLRVWLDEQEMRGDVNQQMTDGIDDSACLLAFITKRYLLKAGGKGPNGDNDNCKLEFDYGLRRKKVENFVVAVMERGCMDPNEWQGVVGGKLGGKLYINLTEDLSEPRFYEGVD